MKCGLVGAVLVASACSELPDIQPGVCGNGIVDLDEDCDQQSSACDRCGLRCDPGCPSNYRCGADGFCHAPGGEFVESRFSTPFPVLGFGLGDLDRDGYSEIMGLASTSLLALYGDAEASLSDTYSVVMPRILGAPAVTDLENRGVIDLIIPTADGLVAYTGALGVPSPRPFPFITGENDEMGPMPQVIDVVPIGSSSGVFTDVDGPGPSNLLGFTLLGINSEGPTFDARSSLCTPIPLTDFDRSQVTLYRRPTGAVVAFTPTSGNTCVFLVEKLAMPAARGSAPWCPDVSNPGDMGPAPPCEFSIQTLTDQSFPRLAKRPGLVDLDGDGCPSVIDIAPGPGAFEQYAGTTGGVGCQIATSSTTLQPILEESAQSELLGAVRLEPPIANAAAEALIMTNGIYAVRTNMANAEQIYASDRPVNRAVVGDLDSDGGLDVVLSVGPVDGPAQQPAQAGIDFVRRVKTADQFLLNRIGTVGGVVNAAIGDFDGDGYADLAYVEQLGPEQRLSVSYGAPGALAPGVAADAFVRIQFMAIVQVTDSADPFGLVDDLLVFDSPDPNDASVTEGTLLHGSPQRTLLAYLGVPVSQPGRPYLGVVTGNFINDAAAGESELPDVVGFQLHAATNTTLLHVRPGRPRGRFGEALGESPMGDGPTTPEIGVCPPGGPNPLFCLDDARFIAVPAPDGHDLVLGIDAQVPPRVIWFDPAVTPVVVTTQSSPFEGGEVDVLRVVDLDRDGSVELVGAFRGDSATRGHSDICRVTNAMLHDCVDIARDVIGEPALDCTVASPGRVAPVCRYAGSGSSAKQDDGYGELQLVVSCYDDTRSELRRIYHDGLGFRADPPYVPRAFSRFEQLEVGDVNGDATDDIIVVDTSSGIGVARVFLQETSRESLVCTGDSVLESQ